MTDRHRMAFTIGRSNIVRRALQITARLCIAYQARGSVSSWAGLEIQSVHSSRDDMDVLCQWKRS